MEKNKVKASNSSGGDYECKHPWTFFVQCGGSGIVFGKEKSYTTAFFEAFPKEPSCFLRGEGATVEEAEQQCWDKYQKLISCEHEMERRHRTDGYAYCKHCSYSAMVFEPLTKCKVCNVPTNYDSEKDNKTFYCRKHYRLMPKSKKLSYSFSDGDARYPRKLKKQLKFYAEKEFRSAGCTEKMTFNIKGRHAGSFDCGSKRISMIFGAKRFLRNKKKQYGR